MTRTPRPRKPSTLSRSTHQRLNSYALAVSAAGVSVLALRDQKLPPTINYAHPDPACDLDYVPNRARSADVEYALSNSFGFGGTNAALLFKRWH